MPDALDEPVDSVIQGVGPPQIHTDDVPPGIARVSLAPFGIVPHVQRLDVIGAVASEPAAAEPVGVPPRDLPAKRPGWVARRVEGDLDPLRMAARDQIFEIVFVLGVAGLAAPPFLRRRNVKSPVARRPEEQLVPVRVKLASAFGDRAVKTETRLEAAAPLRAYGYFPEIVGGGEEFSLLSKELRVLSDRRSHFTAIVFPFEAELDSRGPCVPAGQFERHAMQFPLAAERRSQAQRKLDFLRRAREIFHSNGGSRPLRWGVEHLAGPQRGNDDGGI